METNEILKLIDDKEFLDKVYNFSYRRCDSCYEAEDLCHDIILSVISTVKKQGCVNNIYAFVWTVARRVYADYSEKRKKSRQTLSVENIDFALESKENEIDDFIEKEAEREELKRIFREIAFLSKAYRDVMVMYYIDEMKVKDIAATLKISETTVKQRLFSARKIVRKEVECMNERNSVLKPIRMYFFGTGSVSGNDPSTKAGRTFSQNLIYLCKDKERTAKELSEELCVPMAFVEEELEIQCRGDNGTYGMLRELENGKYINNVHLVDYKEFLNAKKIYEKYFPELCDILKKSIKNNEEKILSIPYLSEQNDPGFIMWCLTTNRIAWEISKKVDAVLKEKYFSDITPIKRPYHSLAVVFSQDEKNDVEAYGCDGIHGQLIEDYKMISVTNIYGKHLDAHFRCGYNISRDEKLLMLIRSIGGISVDMFSDDEKETVAKAIECGYLRKKGNVIEPNIVVIDRKDEQAFYGIVYELCQGCDELAEKIAEELAKFMRSHIPRHLMDEYPFYAKCVASLGVSTKLADECIAAGLLNKPEKRLGGEGVLMIVEK